LLLLDPQGAQKRGCILLDHRSAFLEQRVTGVRRHEASGMNLDFVAPAAENRGLVTFGTGNGIEQRPEAILGFKNPLEDFLPFLELRALFRREIRQRLPQFRRRRALTPA
jgi:hypothetical protein